MTRTILTNVILCARCLKRERTKNAILCGECRNRMHERLISR